MARAQKAEQIDDTTIVDTSVENTTSVDETTQPVVESVMNGDEPVITRVNKNYAIMLDNGVTVKYREGNVTMPRSHAEHWYSKAMGTIIVGVPDENSLNGKNAIQAINDARVTLTGLSVQLQNMIEKITDVTEQQKMKISMTANYVKNAIDSLEGI